VDADLPVTAVNTGETEAARPADLAPARPAPSPRRMQAVICLAVFFAALSFFAPAPFYPQMARDLQTTVPLLGQVVTLMALLSAALGLAIGPLSDRFGYRWPLVAGVLAIAVTLLGAGLAPVYPVLLGLGLVGGLGDALAYSLPFAVAATYFSGEEQRRAMGWTVAALSLAPVIGVPLLTLVGGVSSWRVALVVAGLAAGGTAWFVAASLPPDERRAATSLSMRSLLAAYEPLLRHPPSLRLYAVSALRGMGWIGLLTYLGAYLGTAVGLSTAGIGLAYALGGGVYALGSVVAGNRLQSGSARSVVAIACVVQGLLIGPMLLLPSPMVVLPLLIVVCAMAAISGVGVPALLAAESPAGAGTTMVLNGSILNLGAAGGTTLGGLLIALGGYQALGIGLPIFTLFAAILAWWPARA
jgi:MFS transporter, DHA1 family, inner membrane transport protein